MYYLIIKDTFTRCKYSKALTNKSLPTSQLYFFFEQHTPNETKIKNMTVRIDKGGKLGILYKFCRVFYIFRYIIDAITPDFLS